MMSSNKKGEEIFFAFFMIFFSALLITNSPISILVCNEGIERIVKLVWN